MKRLIIHIGLPKTATTSLQHNLFLKLHEDGHLSYLGRADQEPEFFANRRNYAKEVRDALFAGRSIRLKPIDLGVTQFLMSDESFTVPAFYNRYAFGHDYSVFEIASKLRSTFEGEIDQFSILVSIRNQADLLESLYAQRYDRFFRDPDHNHPDRHFLMNGEFNSSLFPELDYVRLLKTYYAEFGEENVHVALYEDFLESSADYFSTLAKVLRTRTDYIEQCLKAKPRNITEIESGHKVRSYTARSRGYVRIVSLAKRFGAGRLSDWVPDSVKRATFRQNRLIVPAMSTDLHRRIRDFHANKNRGLADLGLDQRKLIQYRYY